jgi:hypothetical protein
MEETPNPTSQESGKSVLGAEMWMEVLVKVIAPRIAACVNENKDIENRQQLHKAFCHQHSVKMSYSTFSGWCEDLGISFKKRIEVSIPGWKATPAPRTKRADYVPPVEQPVVQEAVEQVAEPEPLEPLTWDEPVKPSEMFSDNLPNILPGGMRAPAFLNQSDYSN